MEESLEMNKIDEMKAWKLMMDSMVKFIQASTRLMNTLNNKANSQFSLPASPVKQTSLRTLFAPAFTALDNSQLKKNSLFRPETAPISGDIEKLSDEYDCKGRMIRKSRFFKNNAVKNETEKTELIETHPEHNGDRADYCDVNNNSIEVEKQLRSDDETPTADEHSLSENEDTSITNPNCDISAGTVTKLMTLKLEQAQKEINDLKKELAKVQAAKRHKVTNLYKEIIMDSSFDQSAKCPFHNKADSKFERFQSTMIPGKGTLPIGSPMNPPECRQRYLAAPPPFRSDYVIGNQMGNTNYYPATAQRKCLPHRLKPRQISDMGCMRQNRQARCRMHSASGYEQVPIEMYHPINYQEYQKQLYPIYTKPTNMFNSQKAALGHGYMYQTGQPMHEVYGGKNDCNFKKNDNYLSMSDDASVEDYCENELV